MSIESLLMQEPLCLLQRMSKPGETDAGGVQLPGIIDVGTIVGRLSINSADEVAMWQARNVKCTYTFTSTDGRPRLSMLIKSFDGRTFRVVADQSIEYWKGNIRPNTYEYPLVEVTTGTGGASHG